MLKVKLPDGSIREYTTTVRPIEIAAEIGPAPGQGHAGRRGRRQSGRRQRAAARVGRGAAAAADQERPEALARHAAFGRPRHGPGRDAAVRRGAVGVRADDRQRLLLRLRSAAQAERRGFSADRGRDGPDRQAGRAVRADRRAARRSHRNLPRSGPDAQGRAHRDRAWPTNRPCRSIGRENSSICAAARTFPAPARSARSSCCRWPAPIGRGTPRGSSCSGCMPRPGSRKEELEELSEDGRRGQAPRPSRAGQAARTVHDQSAGRRRA